MFRGTFEHTLDDKARVNLPRPFRATLEAMGETSLIVTTSVTDAYLFAFPVSKWQVLEQKVISLPRMDPNVELFERLFIAGAQECPFDKQGRILLPQSLRDHARITRELVFAGFVDRMQIWDRDAWRQAQQAARANPGDIRQTMASLGL